MKLFVSIGIICLKTVHFSALDNLSRKQPGNNSYCCCHKEYQKGRIHRIACIGHCCFNTFLTFRQRRLCSVPYINALIKKRNDKIWTCGLYIPNNSGAFFSNVIECPVGAWKCLNYGTSAKNGQGADLFLHFINNSNC